MIKVEHIEVFNFEGAIRGLRNPMNSWDKSDSIKCYANRNCPGICKNNSCGLCVGDADLDLMQRLFKAGTEHRKYLRQIFVSMDIVAPVYFVSELDTYKVGTVRNSCSFMHKGVSKPFEITDFSTHDVLVVDGAPSRYDRNANAWKTILDTLNQLREEYLDTKDNDIFQQIRCLLPSGYNQRFTLTMNYENVFSIIKQRTGHRLNEWDEFIKILKTLPYVKEIGGYED